MLMTVLTEMNSLYSFSNELCPLLNRAHDDFKSSLLSISWNNIFARLI